MAVPNAYLFSAKNLPGILSAIQDAGVPARFTNEFIKSLGYTSSNDRAVIGVFKALGFLDQSGAPTERYRSYRNKKEAPYVLAEAIREAYSDVFLANEHAETLPGERVKGILATRTDKGDAVLDKMVGTFRALVNVAKWDRSPNGAQPTVVADPAPTPVATTAESETDVRWPRRAASPEYHYNIQIHLPATTDISVYNAIFKSLQEHLL